MRPGEGLPRGIPCGFIRIRGSSTQHVVLAKWWRGGGINRLLYLPGPIFVYIKIAGGGGWVNFTVSVGSGWEDG